MTDVHLSTLLHGCKQFDRKSQEKLYQQFYPRLFALCHQFFDDEHDILTALNNGMLQVFTRIETFDAAKGDLFGWVYAVVRNSALSLVRQKKSVMRFQEFTSEMYVEIVHQNPLINESEERVAKFLKALSLTTRAVFSLFYVEGMLIKEIAQSLEMKEGTVKWHLNDGRNKLKSMLQEPINNHLYAK